MRLDRWAEVLETLSRNRFRTALTALSVAWGIFMLVILLGVGTGLENQVAWQFRDDAVNSIWLYSGETTIPHKGHAVGRPIQFTNRDFELIANRTQGVEYATGRFYLWGESMIKYGDKSGAFEVRSCHPDHQYIEHTEIISGRFLNDLDIAERRKVTVLGIRVAEFLFGDRDPLGEQVQINNIAYRVVGIFQDSGGEGEMRKVYLPISTAQLAYAGGERVHQIMFSVGDAGVEESQAIADAVKAILAARHHFDPDDPRAVRVRNNLENFQEIQQIFTWLRSFIWMVGIGTVAAGIVGVGNIMLISVRERTREFGLRKALGATPGSIVALVMKEAVLLTAVSGYVGLVAGVAVVEGLRTLIPENEYIRDPEVALGAALVATGLIIAAGALAGFFPARRAAMIQPVAALRDE